MRKGNGKKAYKAIAKSGAKSRKAISGGKSMPNLDDFRKTVPKGGLLNPGLRKGAGLGLTSKSFK